MGISAKLLGEDERVVTHTRTHWKSLIGPVLVLLIAVGAASFLAAIIPDGGMQTIIRLVIAGIALIAALLWTVRPFLNWYFETYTLTNRRMITRRGILNRSGRDIPLMRINDVSYEHGLIDRLLRCGTLVIQSASEGGQVVLDDIPHVERLHLQMSDLLFGGPDGKPGDGVLEDDEAPPPHQRIRKYAEPEEDGSTLFSSDKRDDRRN